MKTYTCTACHEPVPAHEAVQRGDAMHDTPKRWHRDCWTVVRATRGLSARMLDAPLTSRLAEMRAR